MADIGDVEDFLKRVAAALDMRFTHEFETLLPPAVIGEDIIAARQELRDAGDRICDSMRKGILYWKPEQVD